MSALNKDLKASALFKQSHHPGKFKARNELTAFFKKKDQSDKTAKPAAAVKDPTARPIQEQVTEAHLTAGAALGLSAFVGMSAWLNRIKDQSNMGYLNRQIHSLMGENQQLREDVESLGTELQELKSKPSNTIDSHTQNLLMQMYEDIRNRLQKLDNPELKGLTQQAPGAGSAIRRGLSQLFGDKTGFYDYINPEHWM